MSGSLLCATFSTTRDPGADLELEVEPGVLERLLLLEARASGCPSGLGGASPLSLAKA